jgi:hypothetical protein
MYDELRRVEIPLPQSYHLPLIYIAMCVKMFREAVSIFEVSSSSHTCGNTLKNPGLRVGNSHGRSTRGILDSMVLFHAHIS